MLIRSGRRPSSAKTLVHAEGLPEVSGEIALHAEHGARRRMELRMSISGLDGRTYWITLDEDDIDVVLAAISPA